MCILEVVQSHSTTIPPSESNQVCDCRNVLSMHRLVQEAVKLSMDQATRSRWALVVVAGVIDYTNKLSADKHYLSRLRLLPHMLLCIKHMENHGIQCDGMIRLIRRCCADLAISGR